MNLPHPLTAVFAYSEMSRFFQLSIYFFSIAPASAQPWMTSGSVCSLYFFYPLLPIISLMYTNFSEPRTFYSSLPLQSLNITTDNSCLLFGPCNFTSDSIQSSLALLPTCHPLHSLGLSWSQDIWIGSSLPGALLSQNIVMSYPLSHSCLIKVYTC